MLKKLLLGAIPAGLILSACVLASYFFTTKQIALVVLILLMACLSLLLGDSVEGIIESKKSK